MKKFNILLFTFSFQFLIFNSLHAQLAYNSAFSLGNNATDYGYSIAVDGSGNYYCTGAVTYWMNANPLGTPYFIYNNGGLDIYVAKYNSSGIMSWAFDIGGSGDDYAYKINLDANNNVYITGKFNGTVDFDPGAGTANRTSNGSNDIFLAKYNSNGIFQWSDGMGGSSTEQGWDVTTDPVSGNVIITGSYQSPSMDMDPGSGSHLISNNGNAAFSTANCFVAAYSESTGAYQWAFNIGGFDGASGNTVAVDNSGNIYVGGDVTGDSADFDPGAGNNYIGIDGKSSIFLAKYNSNSLLQWANGTVGPGGVTSNSIACDNSGNVYQGGYFNGFFGNDSIDMDPGAGTFWLHTNGVQDAYVRKLNSSGQVVWAFSIGGTGSEVAQDIALDNAGHFFITGNFGATVDFDPGTGVHNLVEMGTLYNGDAYIAEYDLSGNYINAIPISGNASEFGLGICTIPPNKVGVTGFFGSDTIDFDPGPIVHNLYVNGGASTWTDAFVATYAYNAVGIDEPVSNESLFSVYPNPASQSVVINCPLLKEGNLKLIIFDVFGNQILKAEINDKKSRIDVSHFDSGIYFVQLSSERKTTVQKLIVQH